jgi:prepilin-type N-terminal cleavage/methylation domain-containing protein
MKKRAFTLVEVLIVMIILSILFVALASRIDFSITSSKEMNVRTDFLSYELALEQVALEEKELNENMEKLRDQLNVHLDYELMVEADGGTLKTNKEDPWGNVYQFEYTRAGGDLGSVRITSAGADMKFNTTDDLTTTVSFKNTPYGYKVITE